MKLCAAITALFFSSLVAAAASPPPKAVGHQHQRRKWWAGAVVRSRQVTEASGTIRVPKVSLPANAEPGTAYGGVAWIGIDDAETCSDQILQTGIRWQVDEDGVYYHAWYEYWPVGTWEFWDIEINEGDEIFMRVVAHSATSGSVYLTNKSTGEHVSHTFRDQPALCQGTAEWIVEQSVGDRNSILAAFKPVTFTGASYTHNRGHRDALLGAATIEMRQDGHTVADSKLTGHDSVSIRYLG